MQLSSISLALSRLGSSGVGAGSALALDFTSGNQALDPRITFSRTTNATLTTSAGLVANAPMNLLTFSEQFDNAAWTKQDGAVTANAAAAPNGTTTADKYVASAISSSIHRVLQTSTATASGSACTFSVYVKKAEYGYASVAINVDGTLRGVFVDLTAGTITNYANAPASSSITSAGDGWYRVVVTATSNTTSGTGYVFQSASTTNTYTGDGTSGIYLWGAQLEAGSTATTYNPTTVKNLLGFTEHFDNAAWTKSNAFVQTNLLTYSQDFDNAVWAAGSGGAAVVTANTATAPDGSSTADTLDDNSGVAVLGRVNTATVTAGTGGYSASVYIKRNTSNCSSIRVNLSGGTSVVAELVVDTANGAAQWRTGVPGTSFSSSDVGNGWYRYVVTITGNGTANTSLAVEVRPSFAATYSPTIDVAATGSVFVWGAQVVQGTSAGDYKATYAAAAAVGYTDIYGQPFAQKLVEDTAAAAHSVANGISASIVGTPYTGTVYVKAAERQFAFVGLNGGGIVTFAGVDLSTGAVSVVTGSSTVSATSVGNGWYRVSVTATATSTAFLGIDVRVSTDGVWANRAYAGNGTSGIYIFGAQLSDSASVDPYVYQPVAAPSSGAYYGPRFDYDPVTLAPKGLLIEEQRTNLLTYSEQFDNAAWVLGNATVTANALSAPDGTTTADMATITAANAASIRQTVTVSPSTAYTFSFYVRRGTATSLKYSAYNVTGAADIVVPTDYYASTSGTQWTRVSFSFTTPVGCTSVYVYPFRDGASTGTVYFWGAQLEAGAFATSYIPTVASQVTRAADSASMIGNNFARWYNQTEGSVYYEGDRIVGASSRQLTFSDGTSANSLLLYSSGVDALQYCTGVAASATVWDLARSSVSSGVPFKEAFGYAANNVGFVLNAGAVIVDTVNTIPVVDRMLFGQTPTGASAQQSQHIKRIAYYNRRLSNSELTSITS